MTGLSLQTTDVARKRLQLVRELVPGANTVALLGQKVREGTTANLVEETRAAARAMQVSLVVREITEAKELEAAFAQFRDDGARALIVQVSPLLYEIAPQIAAAAARAKLPAIYEARNFIDAGGLASYGPDLNENYRRAAVYVDRILKGAKPATLPVEQPDKLELVINRKAASALGLALPQPLLLRADTVID